MKGAGQASGHCYVTCIYIYMYMYIYIYVCIYKALGKSLARATLPTHFWGLFSLLFVLCISVRSFSKFFHLFLYAFSFFNHFFF